MSEKVDFLLNVHRFQNNIEIKNETKLESVYQWIGFISLLETNFCTTILIINELITVELVFS